MLACFCIRHHSLVFIHYFFFLISKNVVVVVDATVTPLVPAILRDFPCTIFSYPGSLEKTSVQQRPNAARERYVLQQGKSMRQFSVTLRNSHAVLYRMKKIYSQDFRKRTPTLIISLKKLCCFGKCVRPSVRHTLRTVKNV